MSEQPLSRSAAYRDLVETRRAVRVHRTDQYDEDVLREVLEATIADSVRGGPGVYAPIRPGISDRIPSVEKLQPESPRLD